MLLRFFWFTLKDPQSLTHRNSAYVLVVSVSYVSLTKTVNYFFIQNCLRRMCNGSMAVPVAYSNVSV